jgi:hypothetical protein
LIRAVAVLVLGVMAALVALPGAASAASANKLTLGGFTPDGAFTSTLGADWNLGDCTLFPSRDGNVTNMRITRPDATGHAMLTWNGVSQTSHTNGADVWWTTFNLYTVTGGFPFYTTPRLRSPDMTVVNRVYVWSVTVPITLDLATWSRFAFVGWDSSC